MRGKAYEWEKKRKLYEITFCKSDGDNIIFFEIFPNLPHKRLNRLYLKKKKKRKRHIYIFFYKPNLGVLIHAQ